MRGWTWTAIEILASGVGYMRLVIRGIQINAVPARREVDLSAEAIRTVASREPVSLATYTCEFLLVMLLYIAAQEGSSPGNMIGENFFLPPYKQAKLMAFPARSFEADRFIGSPATIRKPGGKAKR